MSPFSDCPGNEVSPCNGADLRRSASPGAESGVMRIIDRVGVLATKPSQEATQKKQKTNYKRFPDLHTCIWMCFCTIHESVHWHTYKYMQINAQYG